MLGTKSNKSQAEEEMKLVVTDWQLEKMSNSNANLKDFLDSKVKSGQLNKVTENEDGSYTIEIDEYKGTINKNGELDGEIINSEKQENEPEKVEPGELAKKTEKDNYTDVNKNKATIPKGFKVSEEATEQSINKGLVVKAPDDSEFVWVPVPVVVAESSPNEPTDVTASKPMAVNLNAASEDDAEPQYRGVLYNFSGTNSSVMSGCITNDNGFREPANLSTSYDNSTNISEWDIDMYQSEYNSMIKSVIKYGGFYVGRYETSYNNQKVESIAGKKPMVSTDSNQKWYGLYEKQKNYASANDISSIVTSSMIWGSQWDAMLNWMLTNDDEKEKVTANSKSHTLTTTGSTPNDVINNIYDLGNNLFEWTLEAYSNNKRARRGSSISWSVPPSSRYQSDFYPNSSVSDYGTRLSLYIN